MGGGVRKKGKRLRKKKRGRWYGRMREREEREEGREGEREEREERGRRKERRKKEGREREREKGEKGRNEGKMSRCQTHFNVFY